MSKSSPSPRTSPASPEPGHDEDGVIRSGRVALVGRANVGKSTLLNALVGEPVAITSPHPQTTREVVRGVLTSGVTQYVFVDTPGIHTPRTRLGERMNASARQHAHDADAVVLVTEATEPRPPPPDVTLAAELGKLRIVLVLNKVDRLKDKTALLALIQGFAEAGSFAAIVPLSAKRDAPTRGGVQRLLHELRGLLPEQPWLYEPDTLSDQPQRFFVAELVREQILRHTRQEVPHGVAIVVERFDETVTPARIEATVHVARESHIKIVVGAGGRMLKSIGTAARARIERVLGARVHLELRVRATPDWMDDEARLRELGYGPPER